MRISPQPASRPYRWTPLLLLAVAAASCDGCGSEHIAPRNDCERAVLDLLEKAELLDESSQRECADQEEDLRQELRQLQGRALRANSNCGNTYKYVLEHTVGRCINCNRDIAREGCVATREILLDRQE